MKSREAGEVSSGCLSAGLWRLQGQRGKNSVGSDSSLCVSFVSRQLPPRNETVTVKKLLNSCLQCMYVLPWSEAVLEVYQNCDCKAVLLCASEYLGIGVLGLICHFYTRIFKRI